MTSEYETRSDTQGTEAGIFRRLRNNEYVKLIANITPSAVWLTVFFLVPLAVMFYYSFGQRGVFGTVLLAPKYLGLQQYAQFFIPDGMGVLDALWVTVAWILERIIPFIGEIAVRDPTPYVELTIRSIWFGLVTTVVALLIGYPTAYFIARGVSEQYRNWLLFLVVLPYWASFLVRIYAIKLLLAKNGILANLIGAIPFVAEPTGLLFSSFAVKYGLLYVWVPFMILPVYANIENIDFTLHEAVMDLGGDRLDAFFRVTFPLSMPGITAGSVLVFIPSVGAYVIPALLGGPNSMTIGLFIALQFGAAGNWSLGAAAAFVLMAIMLLIIGAYQRRAGGELL